MGEGVGVAEVDPVLAAACEQYGVDPGDVLDWRAYGDRVVFVLRDGRKLQAGIRTEE